jgi:hypothetical protein
MDTYQFKLIEGNFSSQDAKTVLMSVINSKINFHNLNAFSEFVKKNEDKFKRLKIEEIKKYL